MGKASRYFKGKGSMKKISTSPQSSFKKNKKPQFMDIDCSRVMKPQTGRASRFYKRNAQKISAPPWELFAKRKKPEVIDIDSCRTGNPDMGRASRHYKRSLKKISTPLRNSFSNGKKPQIIDIAGGKIANPEIICLDSNSSLKGKPQFIDLEDDDVTILPVHATSFKKKKQSRNKSKNDIFILDDDIFIDAPSESTTLNVVNRYQSENNSVSKGELNLQVLESYSSDNNHPSTSPDCLTFYVGQSSDSKTQPFLQLPDSNPFPEPVLKNSSENSLDSSPSCKPELSSLIASDQVPSNSNFTPYKRTFDLPDLSEINNLKKEENILSLSSENSSGESAPAQVNNSTTGPNIVRNKPNLRNNRKSVKEVTAQQTSDNSANHRYPLRSRGLSASAPHKSFPKPNSRNKKLAVKKNEKDSRKLPCLTLDHSNRNSSISKNIVEPFNASVATAKAPDEKIETEVYVSPKRDNEGGLPQKRESTSPALNFIPIPSASKEIEDELVQIYNNNKNRKSMKTDFSSIKINLEGSADDSTILKRGLTKKQRKKELWKIAQMEKKREKSLRKKQSRKQKSLSKNNNSKIKLKKFKGLKTLQKNGKRSLRKSNSPKNTRMSFECNDPCHSTPFQKQSRKRESEGSSINVSNRSFGNFNWITLDAYHTKSEDQSHPSDNSASHNSPTVSPRNYSRSCSNSSYDRSLRSRNESESSSCEEIPVNTEVIDSAKEVVVIDDRDAAADLSDISLSSEESFSVDIGSNVFIPDGVSFKGRRPIIIDGSNVAFSHGIATRGLRVFSSKGIEICAKYFTKRGHKVIVFIPMFRRWSCQTLNPEILQKMSDKGLITYTPSRKIKSRLSVPYDDRYIVQCAVALGGVIVSTDNYKDLLKENRTWKNTIEKRLLMFTFVGDMLMFPQDPLGRHGPKLDNFLMFPR